MAKHGTKEIKFRYTKSGCWICISHCINEDGYALVYRNNKAYKLHRYMYEQYKGEIPKGMYVRHTCNNPACGNPEHLAIGTQQDNMNDMIRSGNSLKGELCPNAKLTNKEVREIKKKLKNKKYGMLRKLASVYNVSDHTIFDINSGKTWKHIKI